jgi:hypothetical protein
MVPWHPLQFPPPPARGLSIADAPARVPLVVQHTPSPSGLPFDRLRLTREIQLHLKRVGCYHGKIGDTWSQTVRRSIKDFVGNVNATLPVEQPDIILLILLQDHQGRACSPTSVATNDKKQNPINSPDPVTVSPPVEAKLPARLPDSTEPRMSLAGPAPPLAAPPALPVNGPAKASRHRASPPVSASSDPRRERPGRPGSMISTAVLRRAAPPNTEGLDADGMPDASSGHQSAAG